MHTIVAAGSNATASASAPTAQALAVTDPASAWQASWVVAPSPTTSHVLEAVDAGLQSVLKERGKSGRFRIENHDARDNAVLTKFDPFFCAGHSQQGYTVEFQQARDGRTIGSVSGSFDHRNQVRGWMCKFPDICADAPQVMA